MSTPCRIGLLRLADSAPVLVASSWNIFARHGLDVTPVIVPSWANIADGLVWNGLDGAIMFPPLAIMAALGQRGRAIGLQPGLPISRGGNMIVLRGQNTEHALWEDEPDKHTAFKNWQRRLGRKPRLGVVHLYSTHYLILSRFLKNISISRDTETEIVIMPPSRMIQALAEQEIDGFCAGPPWGADAQLKNLAFTVAGSASTVPGHMEKMLIMTEQWKRAHPNELPRLYAALTEAVALCNTPDEASAIITLLSNSQQNNGLDLSPDALSAIMPGKTATEDAMVFDTHKQTAQTAFGWMLEDMQTEGWLSPTIMPEIKRLGWS
ncbi:nitrate ABC transporter ATP-binding protein [Acetobacter lambici]|uniref:ABC transporter substrate-binding protein n=1 Tax=Acetobacter lambici TaxID=1332824 RepID=A0ABT1F3J9_9PROT|nr:ABC transporter substrate-binding protein [Acetobacter lambici]MCP1243695.1 ABC transporter substrate-binding protein [Acetobacter lambici]MCP1259743.1 ABC transporter substrate-binding protein [Acetobacter lambici]NHO57941.1 nitrate ABC transporter ATP-binding protein [Acetobacter lambici]